MNKQWASMLIFLAVVLFICYLIIKPSDNMSYSNYNNDSIVELNVISDSFASSTYLHYIHMPINYQIINKEDCKGVVLNNILRSIDLITNATGRLVYFNETDENIDLSVSCIDRDKIFSSINSTGKNACINITLNYSTTVFSPFEAGILNSTTQYFSKAQTLFRNESQTRYEICYINISEFPPNIRNFLVLGEGGPDYVQENKIFNASVNLYSHENGWVSCAYFPSKEMHELLHTFGFAHSYEPYFDPFYGYTDWSYTGDIMFPHLYCEFQTSLNEKYSSCLKKIYSNGNVWGDCSNVNFFRQY